jgi:TRAP-type C4-dicarboxylate transport system substrate-binding protein
VPDPRATKHVEATMKTSAILTAAATVALLAEAGVAYAQETKLSAVNFLRNNESFGAFFADWVDDINKTGKGLVQIEIKAFGAVPVFEMGNAVKTGVVDMANIPPTFYQNLLPVADGIKMMTKPPEEIRRNGGFAFLNELHHDKVNAEVLCTYGYGVPFHVYLRDKKIDKADLAGLKLRVTPVYRAFFRALGAQIIIMPPNEVLTALERGVVDGYGWPLWDIKTNGWDKYTKFRVEPGFYYVAGMFIANLDKWKSLRPEQRAFLAKKAEEFESSVPRTARTRNASFTAEQDQAGVQAIRLTGAEAEKFVKAAYEAGWEEIVKIDPVNGPKLKKFIYD